VESAGFPFAGDYSITLTPTQLADIDSCVKAVRAAGLELDDIERKHFPLPTLADTLAAIGREVADGRGLSCCAACLSTPTARTRSFPLLGIGTHLGIGQSQSVMGDRLGHVKIQPRGPQRARLSQQAGAQPAHRPVRLRQPVLSAQRPYRGVSRLASALAIHNILLAERPHYLDRLYRGYTWHRRGEQRPGDPP